MITDKNYCMSSFLMYRTIIDRNKTFSDGIIPRHYDDVKNRIPIKNGEELERSLRKSIEDATSDGKAALALSGGIDSAILAKFMPKGSIAYTFKCVVPGIQVTDETPVASKYAKECGLEHRIVEIYWDDLCNLAPALMKRKGAPIHSIEVQIYKAALQAKKDGFKKLIFGESADCLYGGLSKLLSRDWKVGEFIERYSYVKPHHVLKEPILINEPIKKFEESGYVDIHRFLNNVFFKESTSSYFNACDLAQIDFIGPFMMTFLDGSLDIPRVRNGENKYLVKNIFSRLYPGFIIPEKTPMPRPMSEWLHNWEGPTRPEFWPSCIDGMSGDQKWLVYCLEWFLNLIDEGYLLEQ